MEQKPKPFIRVFNTDLVGEKPIVAALQKIQGVSFSMAHAICNALNISQSQKAGLLTDSEIRGIEGIFQSNRLPGWLLNRQKDFDTGKDAHLMTSKLKLTREFDIKRMRKIKCYKGMRHSAGQPVRGQRTKAHFRKGAAVGVSKKKVKAGKV